MQKELSYGGVGKERRTEKMNVFICGRTTNFSKEQYTFAENDITESGYKAINPVTFNEKCGVSSLDGIAAINIALLGLCDAIYVLDGAESDPLANREIGYAIATNMKFMDSTNIIRNYEGE